MNGVLRLACEKVVSNSAGKQVWKELHQGETGSPNLATNNGFIEYYPEEMFMKFIQSCVQKSVMSIEAFLETCGEWTFFLLLQNVIFFFLHFLNFTIVLLTNNVYIF